MTPAAAVPGALVVWDDPGARVIHQVDHVAGDDAVMACGCVYPLRELRAADQQRDYARPLHPRCESRDTSGATLEAGGRCVRCGSRH